MKSEANAACPAPLIVVSGPSGVGKTTIVDEVLAGGRWPLRRAVTATTRDPRPGERAEVDYHFWTRDRFQQAIEAGEMLEHAVVHGRDFYGTPWSEVKPYREQGTGVILVIDVQGAARLRALYPKDLCTIFLTPPNFKELEARLRGRRESEESIRRRLLTAETELRQQGEFHHVVENDDLASSVTSLEKIVQELFAGMPSGGSGTQDQN